MHLVIDGYNLLRRIPELAAAEARGQGRKALLTALTLYRRKKHHKITVVFDGGPDGLPGRATEQGIPIIQSGGEKSADDVIAEMASRQGPGITVITDDRELAGRCQRHGAQVIASWEFSTPLMSSAQGSEFMEPDQDDAGWDFTTKKKGPHKRLPKSKRKKANKLKNL